LALVRFPASLRAGIAFERGRRAEAARNYPLAATEYQIVADQFPDSTLALGRLGICDYRAGRLDQSFSIFHRLGGRETSPELAGEINQIAGEVQSRLR